MRGQVVINELVAENVASLTDEEGDSEDWVELYNAGPAPVDLQGHGLTEEPAAVTRWILPSVEIPSHGHLLVFLSGKDRFVPPPGVLNGAGLFDSFRPGIVSRDAEWRYLVGEPAGAGPPAGWKAIDFDDSGWLAGRSGFGYGDGDDATELVVDTVAVFTRHKFTVANPAQLSNLVLSVDYDDGFIAFLNGTRVASAFAPAEEPSFQTRPSGKREAGSPDFFDLSQHLGRLVAGDNVLAVVGLNDTPSTDMSLIAALGTVPTYLHASFKLEKTGQYLGLVDPAGNVIDGVDLPLQTADHSYGRAGDGGATWGYFVRPTPEAANGIEVVSAPIPDKVLFSPAAGKQSAPVAVTIAPNLPGDLEVRFTTDGSPPVATSTLFSEPIALSTNTVLRAAGFRGELVATPVAAASYFFGGAVELPVMSISMNPADYAEVHNNAGASGRGSERTAFLEYFKGGAPAVSTGCGLRLHGGASRGGDFETKKSYKAYFRSVYGAKKLEYPLIEDTFVEEFDKLVLRAGFNDGFRGGGAAAFIRDQLIRDVHEDMGMIVSHGTWCFLYVNMKPRGILNVVERMDEKFLLPYTGEAEWDVIKTGDDVLVGTADEWNRVRQVVGDQDLSNDAVYRPAAELVDLENFAAYYLLNIWAQNHDWPHNNWYAARPRRPDGKWIFLSWDAEFGIGLIPGGYSSDSFAFTVSQGGSLSGLLKGFLSNAQFREYFVEEADRHRYGALLPASVIAHIRRLRDRIRGDIPEEAALYGQSVASWNNAIAACESFAQNRGTVFFNSIQRSTQYAFPAVTTPRVTLVTPTSIVNDGVQDIMLTGLRLAADTEVYLNDRQATETSLSGTRLRVRVPFDLALDGQVAISVRAPATGKRSDAPMPLEVAVPRPIPTGVSPASGRSAGGDVVRIPGIGFLPGVEVRFGEVSATEVLLIEGTPAVIEARTPPGAGSVDVLVLNRVPGGEVPALATYPYRYDSAAGFVRGDVNADGQMDISDAVRTLGYLFGGEALPDCIAAADANDSGRVDISDAVSILDYLFQGGTAPPAPHPDCGEDPTPDALSCLAPMACGA